MADKERVIYNDNIKTFAKTLRLKSPAAYKFLQAQIRGFPSRNSVRIKDMVDSQTKTPGTAKKAVKTKGTLKNKLKNRQSPKAQRANQESQEAVRTILKDQEADQNAMSHHEAARTLQEIPIVASRFRPPQEIPLSPPRYINTTVVPVSAQGRPYP